VRSERIEGSQENIVKLSDIRREKHRASSPYGPVSQGLTTLQRTDRDQALTELLSSLENVVADLNSKSYTALDTLAIAIQGARVALSATVIDEVGTEVACNDCGNDLVAEGQDKCLQCLEDML
jgi:hypothetical protein